MPAISDHSTVRGVFGGIPSYYLASCWEASQGGAHNNYSNAGWQLATGVGSQVPYDVENEEWVDEVAVLLQLLRTDDGEGILMWFVDHYPKCMKLVPPRRRKQFVEGVRRAYEDERVGM